MEIVCAFGRNPVTDDIDPDTPENGEPLPSEGSLADGMRIIGEFVRTLPRKPGVYRMIAADGEVLYVGKARSLRSRVAAYTQPTRLDNRLLRMVSSTRTMEFAVTDSEAEALLLENNLIKRFKPRFNVLLRDDKSFPYIVIRRDTEWPQLAKHRGTREPANEYFGPFASATAVNRTLYALQRAFPLRSCSDGVFTTRTRPCLQYQIKRCSAPCVGLVDRNDYRDAVHRTELFLDGHNDVLVRELTEAMESASAALEFERAAQLRDEIANLRRMQARQYVDGDAADLDVLACVIDKGLACIVLLAFRNGMNLGTRNFFPKLNGADDPAEVLGAFVTQYYFEQKPPREIILSHAIPDRELIEQVLGDQGGGKVQIKSAVRGERARYLELANENARIALVTKIGSSATQRARLADLQQLLELPEPPGRIECFDISHTMGEATVASCVVFDAEGPVRGQYRRFNIEGITGGDDFAAMRQAITRRFVRAKEDGTMPDLLLIDGGKGQLAQAVAVLEELQVTGVALVGVAKGAARRAGDEDLVLPDGRVLHPGADSPGLHLIQQVRDEAHRFAITGHRGRRAKAREHSSLEDIPGIGARRRAMLLKHFGGLAALTRAGPEDIARVEGINAALAQRIWRALHGLEDAQAQE